MIAIAYFIPVIACLLLCFEFDYQGDWTTYLWMILVGEGSAGLLHWLFYHFYISKTEYLGSLVEDIVHEEEWTELVEIRETKTDNKGRTYTVTRIEERFHPEIYYFHTSIGSEISCSSWFFNNVRNLWKLPVNPLRWSGRNIKYGTRYGSKYTRRDFSYSQLEDPLYWIPITEEHSYTNKIQKSNSIFKYEKIRREEAQELGLYDYPRIDEDYNASCILSNTHPVPAYADEMFRKFNARYAPEHQMRLYILLFDADKGIGISEKQRAYWQGGNKNEFVVCIGLNEAIEVEWARAFSWTDEQTKEVETAQWLMHNPRFEWNEFYDWLRVNLSGWKRKEFKDFNYINVTLPAWQVLSITLIAALEMGLFIYCTQ